MLEERCQRTVEYSGALSGERVSSAGAASSGAASAGTAPGVANAALAAFADMIRRTLVERPG